MVRRMTSRPASIVGLTERGVVRVGAWADLVLLDPTRVADRATWDEPRQPADGIEAVLVNGVPVVEGGRYAGGLAGRVLRAASGG
jgi:N-acyl-D-aspartate/D-glutamate deacylase